MKDCHIKNFVSALLLFLSCPSLSVAVVGWILTYGCMR